MPSIKTLLVSATLVVFASAKTIKVTATSDNEFDPAEVEASEGDVVEFHFQPKNHSVVAGDYQYPCSPMQLGTGFFSGFISSDSGSADKVFQVTINSTDPIPFYSSQGDECSDGMVGIINASGNETLDDYKERASELSRGVTPGNEEFGGELVDSNDAKGDDDSSSGSGKEDKDSDDNAGSSHGVSVAGLLAAVGAAFIML